MDYYTLDFETANANLTSPCSIGIIGVKNKKIVLRKYYLINPEEEFLPFNVAIHSISPEMVKNEKTFPQVWNEIKHLFNNTFVFAHCAGFDLSVLYQTLTKYDIEKPIFRFSDTLAIARLTWDKETIPNHKLNTIAKYLEHEFTHHNALSDAEVCVHIINRALIVHQETDIKELHDKLNLRFGYFSPNRFYGPYQLKKRYKKDQPKINNPLLYNKLIIYSGKSKNYSKVDFINLLINNGAYIDTMCSNKADYFVKLDNYKPEKLLQIKNIIAKNIDIKIITEDELMAMVIKN